MIYKNYNYFITIAQEGSITAAARKLYVSQPSLSKYLKRLESNLGFDLYDHKTSPLKLTPAGVLYYEFLQKEMALEQELLDSLQALKKVQAKDVNFATGPWVSSILMPHITPIIKEASPNLRIHNFVGDDNSLLDMLDSGRVDFILLYDPARWKNLSWQVIKKERILLVCNKNHSFLKNNNISAESDPENIQTMDLRLLKDETFVVAAQGLTLNDVAHAAFKNYNITPQNIQVAANVHTAINMAASNYGFSFIFESFLHSNFVPDCLSFFQIGDPPLTSTLTATYKKSAFLDPSVQTVIDCIRTHYNSTEEK